MCCKILQNLLLLLRLLLERCLHVNTMRIRIFLLFYSLCDLFQVSVMKMDRERERLWKSSRLRESAKKKSVQNCRCHKVVKHTVFISILPAGNELHCTVILCYSHIFMS